MQHFWWWIGYPPAYELTLELGDEKHLWGVSSGSDPLEWKLGQWYHVAVVFKCDGGRSIVTHYRDDTVVGTETINGAFDSGTYDVQLGTYGNLHGLNGAL